MSFRMQLWNPERWQLGKELSPFQREFERFLAELTGQLPQKTSRREVDFVPPCDVEETKTHYLINVDVPGMKKDDLKVELTNELLTISGEHAEEKKEETKNRRVSERYQGRFERCFALPNVGDAGQVEANYSNGVLSIAVPKAMASTSKQIPIGEGKTASKIPVKEQKPRAEAPKSAAA